MKFLYESEMMNEAFINFAGSCGYNSNLTAFGVFSIRKEVFILHSSSSCNTLTTNERCRRWPHDNIIASRSTGNSVVREDTANERKVKKKAKLDSVVEFSAQKKRNSMLCMNANPILFCFAKRNSIHGKDAIVTQ